MARHVTCAWKVRVCDLLELNRARQGQLHRRFARHHAQELLSSRVGQWRRQAVQAASVVQSRLQGLLARLVQEGPPRLFAQTLLA